jgi:hypothetical protein
MRQSSLLTALLVIALLVVPPTRSETQGLNPKRLLLGLASKQLTPYVRENAPINLDWGDLYPTVSELPGPSFTPRSAYQTVMEQYRQSPSGVVALPAGDYTLRVLVFCTHGGVQRLGSAQARWHEQFALGPLRGRRADALSALYVRSAVQGLPYYPTQQVSWDITNGLKYPDFPDTQRALFDRLIPEYRAVVGESQIEQIQTKWRALSSAIPGLPPFEQAINELGPLGQLFKDLQQSRETILQNGRAFDEETRRLAPIVGAPADAPIAPQSWSKLSDRVYARMLVPGDYGGIGSTTTLEMRVIPDQSTNSPGNVPIGKLMAYPNCVYCQPLTLEPQPDLSKQQRVRIFIWDAKWPFGGDTGSVGHVYVDIPDGTYLSTFPANGLYKGNIDNRNRDRTLQKEGGRLPTVGYIVTVPNGEAFDAALRRFADPRIFPTWDFLPTGNQTNCVDSAYRVLKAGGLNPGMRPLNPEKLETELNAMMNTGSVVQISPSSF